MTLEVDDFSSVEALAKTLLEIDADDRRYNRLPSVHLLWSGYSGVGRRISFFKEKGAK